MSMIGNESDVEAEERQTPAATSLATNAEDFCARNRINFDDAKEAVIDWAMLQQIAEDHESRGGCLNFCVRGAERLVHGGGRRLRRTDRRGGQVGATS